MRAQATGSSSKQPSPGRRTRKREKAKARIPSRKGSTTPDRTPVLFVFAFSLFRAFVLSNSRRLPGPAAAAVEPDPLAHARLHRRLCPGEKICFFVRSQEVVDVHGRRPRGDSLL